MPNIYAEGYDEGYKAGLEAGSHVPNAIINEQKKRIAELEKERDRLLVLATKWCDKNHHDWDELLTY